jgi:thiamine kinase-like enzyme
MLDEEKKKKMHQIVKIQEINKLKSILKTNKSDLVFSHNDLNANNIFILNENMDLFLIDFEFAG